MPATTLECKQGTFVTLDVADGLIRLGTAGSDFHDDAYLSAKGANQLVTELTAYAERLGANPNHERRSREARDKLVRTGEHVEPHVLLQLRNNDALLKTTTDFVIASGYDVTTGTWSSGRYLGDDAVSAFVAFNEEALLSDYIVGVDAEYVLDHHPELTPEEAEEVCWSTNANLSDSDSLGDLIRDQMDAEADGLIEHFDPERRRLFELEKRLLLGDTLYNPVTGTFVNSNLDSYYPNYYQGTVSLDAAARFIGQNAGRDDGALFCDIIDRSVFEDPGVRVEQFETRQPLHTSARSLAESLLKEPGELVYPLMHGRDAEDPCELVAGVLERGGRPDLAEDFRSAVRLASPSRTESPTERARLARSSAKRQVAHCDGSTTVERRATL